MYVYMQYIHFQYQLQNIKIIRINVDVQTKQCQK